MVIKLKPISVNDCWQGRRFKTQKYKAYEEELLLLLPRGVEIPEGKIIIYFTFGVSSKASDLDNLLKPTIDILQKKYGFNDKKIYKIIAEKEDVKKGQEFISFNINSFNQ